MQKNNIVYLLIILNYYVFVGGGDTALVFTSFDFSTCHRDTDKVDIVYAKIMVQTRVVVCVANGCI